MHSSSKCHICAAICMYIIMAHAIKNNAGFRNSFDGLYDVSHVNMTLSPICLGIEQGSCYLEIGVDLEWFTMSIDLANPQFDMLLNKCERTRVIKMTVYVIQE